MQLYDYVLVENWKYMCFRLRLFWVKIIFGNAFPEMRMFGWSGKFYFPKIDFCWPKKKGFDYGNEFPFLFSLQMNSGEGERESERETETQSAPFARPSSSQRRSQAPAPSIAIWDRELTFAPIATGAVLREIAIDGAVVGLERAVEPSWSWASIWVLCLFF